MPELLETLDTLRAEDARVSRLFTSDDGRSVRSIRQTPKYRESLREAMTLLSGVMRGNTPSYHLQEAMGTSDFPLLFGDIIDRAMYASYTAKTTSWTGYARREVVPDFRVVNRFVTDGGVAPLTGVPEQGPYPVGALSENRYQFSVSKFGRRYPFSWEAIINDDLGALRDIPERMALAARRTEEMAATSLIADAAGPNATFFTVGNANYVNIANGAVANNPPLSIAGLQDAFQVLGNQLDTDGMPIVIEGVNLIVPPALEVTANNIMNATEVWLSAGADGSATNRQLNVANWMRNKTTIVVNPYLPLVNLSAARNTTWYLFANPNLGRPGLVMAFLRGHESPETFMKSPNATRIGGGGLIDPMDGDFDHDTLEYKVRHVLGGGNVDPNAAVVSRGDSLA